MSIISVQSDIIGDWDDRRTSSLELRIYANSSYITSDGVEHGAGNPFGSGRSSVFVQRVPGLVNTLATHVLTIPAFTLTSTVDALLNNRVRLSFWIGVAKGQGFEPIAQIPGSENGLHVPTSITSSSGCAQAGTCCSMSELILWNQPTSPPFSPVGYYNTTQIDEFMRTVAVGAPSGAKFIVNVPNGSLTNAQPLSALATGLLKNTTATGVLSTAVAGTDYLAPGTAGAPFSGLAFDAGLANMVGMLGIPAETTRRFAMTDGTAASPVTSSAGSPSFSFQRFDAGAYGQTVPTMWVGLTVSGGTTSAYYNLMGYAETTRQVGVHDIVGVAGLAKASGISVTANIFGVYADAFLGSVVGTGTGAEIEVRNETRAVAPTYAGAINLGMTMGLNLVGRVTATWTITAATNATPIAITTGIIPHGFVTGNTVNITNVAGNTAANGTWAITVTGATTFTLDTSVGNGVYTSGGTVNSLKNTFGYALSSADGANSAFKTGFLFGANSIDSAGYGIDFNFLAGVGTSIRFANDTYMAWRNAANTADTKIFGLDSSNKTRIRNDAASAAIIFSNTANSITYATIDVGGVASSGYISGTNVRVTQTVIGVSNGLNSNVDIGTAGFARVGGATGAYSLGGFNNGVDGRILYVFNAVLQTLTIVNEDASSTAANRINTLTGGNVVLPAGSQSFATFIYSGLDSRWEFAGTGYIAPGGGGGGSGTVTSVAVSGANGIGVSGSPITTSGTIALTLGAITPTSVNGLTVSTSTGTLTISNLKTVSHSATTTFAGTDGKTLTISNTGTLAGGDAFVLAIAAAKTFTVSNSLTLAGTDTTTMTFPGTNATIARTDAAQTFTGLQTFGTILSTTSVTSPIHYGGSAVGSTLTLQGTSGVGVGAAYILMSPIPASGVLPGAVLIGAPVANLVTGDVLHVQGTDSVNALITIDAYGTGTVPGFVGRRANNTAASPTATASDNILMSVAGRGYQTTTGAFAISGNAAIQLKAAEAFTSTAQGTRISLETTPLLSATRVSRWLIEPNGDFLAATDGVGAIGNTAAGRPTSLHLSAPSVIPGSGTGVTVIGTGEVRRQTYTVSISYTALAAAQLTADVVLCQLPAKTKVCSITADVTTPFTGGAVSAATMTLGKTTGGAEYLVSFDVKTATIQRGVSNDADLGTALVRSAAVQGGDTPSWSGTTNVSMRLTTVTAFTNALTAGVIVITIETQRPL